MEAEDKDECDRGSDSDAEVDGSITNGEGNEGGSSKLRFEDLRFERLLGGGGSHWMASNGSGAEQSSVASQVRGPMRKDADAGAGADGSRRRWWKAGRVEG